MVRFLPCHYYFPVDRRVFGKVNAQVPGNGRREVLRGVIHR